MGDGGWGLGDWGLGIGDWAQSPIPNPQSPIPQPPHPNPKYMLKFPYKNYYFKNFKLFLNFMIKSLKIVFNLCRLRIWD